MTGAQDIIAALAAWPDRAHSAEPLGGGWNSSTWLVDAAGGRYVAKVVDPVDAAGLVRGLLVAEFATARGLICGAPLRTRGGNLTVELPRGALALLRYVRGNPPDLSVPRQVARAGRVLARAHRILAGYAAESDLSYRWPWEWVPRCLDTIDMPADVNEAARRTWREVVDTVEEQRLTVGLIHADPGPDSFLLSARDPGQDALIDWATTLRGPLLYDLASFLVIAGPAGSGTARWFVEGYAAELPEIRPELAHLDTLVRARWVANAIYFSSRIERGIARESDSPTANRDGLIAAFHGMTARRTGPTNALHGFRRS